MPALDPLKLIDWFQQQKRDLPWRNQPSPYAVWVSEVMLQQTQVSVVVPYFLRWMQRFPTVADLAKASVDEVIKEWEGLGYYSRARCLHAGAKYVMEQHGGIIPQTEEELKAIKGLGPYTIGAIRSFAFHHPVAAVDGNVVRVLARYFKLEEDISKPKTMNQIRQMAQEILPKENSWIFNEALIELGATICTKKPKCSLCPINRGCAAYLHGKEELLPNKSAKVKTEILFRAVAVISCGDSFLIKRGESGMVMSDLHEFPYFEISAKGISHKKLALEIQKSLKLPVNPIGILPPIQHSFTRFRVHLFPMSFSCGHPHRVEGYQWMPLDALRKLAFSSGHRRIFHEVIPLKQGVMSLCLFSVFLVI